MDLGGPRNHVLGGSQITTENRAIFSGGLRCDVAFRQNALTTCEYIQEFEVYIGSYRDTLRTKTQTKEHIVNTADLSGVKYVSMAYIERCVYN